MARKALRAADAALQLVASRKFVAILCVNLCSAFAVAEARAVGAACTPHRFLYLLLYNSTPICAAFSPCVCSSTRFTDCAVPQLAALAA
jgi:hypothetical protein